METRLFPCSSYGKVRDLVHTGDIIAYNGRGLLSGAIRLVSGYPTHVAMVSRTTDTTGIFRIQCIESTSMKVSGQRIIGVQYTYLSERLQNYDGDIWWLSLKPRYTDRISQRMDYFLDLLKARDGSRYDFCGALREGWDSLFPRLFPVKEVDRRFFCSALVTFIFCNMGILPSSLNHRTVSPLELCQFNLYAYCNQLAGKPKKIPGINTKEF